MDFQKVLKKLEALPKYESEGKEHIYNSELLKLSKKIGKNNILSNKLWDSSEIGTKRLSIYIFNYLIASQNDLELRLKNIFTWGICDAFCNHIVTKTKFAIEKGFEWSKRKSEFEKRAGFSTIAQLAWRKKSNIEDKIFIDFLKIIKKEAFDERFYVKKAINWALRDIGKRNKILQKHTLKLASELQQSENKTAQWIGKHRFHEIKKEQK